MALIPRNVSPSNLFIYIFIHVSYNKIKCLIRRITYLAVIEKKNVFPGTDVKVERLKIVAQETKGAMIGKGLLLNHS